MFQCWGFFEDNHGSGPAHQGPNLSFQVPKPKGPNGSDLARTTAAMPPFPAATTTSHLALLVLLSSSSLFFLYKSFRLRRKPSPAAARTATPTLLYAPD